MTDYLQSVEQMCRIEFLAGRMLDNHVDDRSLDNRFEVGFLIETDKAVLKEFAKLGARVLPLELKLTLFFLILLLIYLIIEITVNQRHELGNENPVRLEIRINSFADYLV